MLKKLTRIFTLSLLATLSLGLTSCEDEWIADYLDGTWRGNMYISHSWNNRVYQSTYSEIAFLRDPHYDTSGSGYWIDYYSNAPWDYIANHIDWHVSDGDIYIHFLEEDSYLQICDYDLDDDRFTGIIYEDDLRIRFSLIRITPPNWDDFDWGYDHWRGSGWAKRTTLDNGGSGTADSIRPAGKEAMPRRMVRVPAE